MGSVVAINQHPGDANNLLAKMSAELQDIMAQVEKVMKKSSDLAEQLSIYEDRQPYLAQALEESRKVAADIDYDAELRINAVLERAEAIAAPQRAQIAQLETEAAELQQAIQARQPVCEDMPVPERVSDGAETPAASNVLNIPSNLEPARTVYQPQISLETLLSVNGTAALDMMPSVMADPEIEVDCQESEIPDPGQLQGQIGDEDPQSGPTAGLAGDMVAGATADNPTDFKVDMVPVIETMDLEANITIQRFNLANSWHRRKSRHDWQLKLQVEVPEEAAHVIYNQVVATVNSTLAPYDDVLLSDVFPFDLIEPNDENVVSYLFNSLEDNLSLRDLILTDLNVCKGDVLVMRKEARNTDIDQMLKGEDIIEQMRANLLAKSANGEVGAEKPVKKKFGFFRKN